MFYQILMLMFVLVLNTQVEAWKNSWDQLLHFECPSDSAISFMKSKHDNKREDRLWDFSCRELTGSQTNCKWSGYVNNFDKTFTYQCPGNGYIAGIVSYHQNKQEDRRHKFKCCDQIGYNQIHSCYNTGFTDYDQYFSYNVPSGHIWRGLTSQHNNKREDRVFNFMFCRIGK